MCWLFQCDDGWFKLIDRLSAKIVKLDPRVEASCVKEKFGTLRFYVDTEMEAVYDVISKAEKESSKTCEVCGKPGKLHNDKGWWATLCKKCRTKLTIERDGKLK